MKNKPKGTPSNPYNLKAGNDTTTCWDCHGAKQKYAGTKREWNSEKGKFVTIEVFQECPTCYGEGIVPK